jgi:NADH-quinone oxidoreductase subunit E
MEILLYLLIASLIGFVLAWTIKGGSKKENSVENKQKQTPNEVSVEQSSSTDTPKTTAPNLLKEAREGGKDNLSLLKGIGPVVEEKLNKLGIYHLDQIASWNAEEQAWVDEQILFPRKVEREEWTKQAKELSQS